MSENQNFQNPKQRFCEVHWEEKFGKVEKGFEGEVAFWNFYSCVVVVPVFIRI